MSVSKASKDDISKDGDVHAPDFEAAARDIQNWVCRCLGTAAMEARHFHELLRGQGAMRTTTLKTMAMVATTRVVARWRMDKWDGNNVSTKTTHQ